MIRMLVAMALLLAGPALAQNAVASTDASGERGWIDTPGAPPVLGAAGIGVPREAGGQSLAKLGERTGKGFDGIVNYRGADGFLTLFVYRPIDRDARLQWLAIRRAMAERSAGGALTGDATALDVPAGGFLVLQQPGTSRGSPVSELVALGETSHGWLIKARVTFPGDAAATLAAARAVLSALTLPTGVRISRPGAWDFPVCAARDLPGAAPDLPASRTPEERMADTLLAVLSLALDRGPPDRPLCGLGEVRGPFPIAAFRTPAADGTPTYVATLGDAGAIVRLELQSAPGKDEKWWLSLDTLATRVVLKAVRGPVDDADFLSYLNDLPQIMQQPIITEVGRE